MNTYSILIRVQRVTTEYAYVSVPISPDLRVENEDGTDGIDVPMIMERAVELGHLPQIAWYVESQQIELNPIQQPPKPGEEVTPGLTKSNYVFIEETSENQ